MSSFLSFFAPCPKGLELLLLEELKALGAVEARETRAGVGFTGDLETAYRACLWSRLASRILLPLKEFVVGNADDLYAGAKAVNWEEHLAPEGTLAVDCSASGSVITHSHYAALKVKDAVVDQLRERHGARPSVDTVQPDVRINVYIHGERAVLSLDLSGESLHRRGYRKQAGEAPLKENLAAAILLRAGWPGIAERGGPLIDLMCGSGTLLIEGALMAADIAPGLLRTDFGFLKWRGHAAQSWDRLLAEARARRDAGLPRLPPVHGYDRDSQVIGTARANIRNAGLEEFIAVNKRELAACEPETAGPGLVAVNPPYGERLGADSELPALYAELGAQLLRCFDGWQAAVFTGNPELGKHMRLRATRYHTLWNGAIECRLLHFDVSEERAMRERAPKPVERSPGMEMLENRLRKNLRHLGRWSRRENISCYRLYDADLPEYNLAVDIYTAADNGGTLYAHVQEYQAPETVDAKKAQMRWREALDAIPRVLEIPPQNMSRKQRRRQKDGAQYEKQADTGVFHEVSEGPARFLVNFNDYLDTGLFLDHRLTRALIGELARGRHFLNLFGYTGTASVHAALGGARSTATVDMSNTYLDWARRNFELNGIRGKQHRFIQADVLEWLRLKHKERYGLIFLDPPTFSRSKRMEDTLDIQRDHISLLRETAALLDDDGVLVFSTNLRKFKLERDALTEFEIEDISKKTLPEDFKNNPKIHQCFIIRKKDLSPRRKDAKLKTSKEKTTGDTGNTGLSKVSSSQPKPRRTLTLKK